MLLLLVKDMFCSSNVYCAAVAAILMHETYTALHVHSILVSC